MLVSGLESLMAVASSAGSFVAEGERVAGGGNARQLGIGKLTVLRRLCRVTLIACVLLRRLALQVLDLGLAHSDWPSRLRKANATPRWRGSRVAWVARVFSSQPRRQTNFSDAS